VPLYFFRIQEIKSNFVIFFFELIKNMRFDINWFILFVIYFTVLGKILFHKFIRIRFFIFFLFVNLLRLDQSFIFCKLFLVLYKMFHGFSLFSIRWFFAWRFFGLIFLHRLNERIKKFFVFKIKTNLKRVDFSLKK
jgi:hypothetical protein